VARSVKPYTARQERLGRRFIRVIGRFNIWLYRKSNGRLGAKMPGYAAPICLLTTTGRRTGLARTSPLLYMPDGHNVVVVASQGGMSKHPEWYLNLVASPKVTVDIDGDARAMLAHTASAEERARLWPLLVAMYPPYEQYQQRTTREIPVVICSPDI
jgi:deazaflavin-dependent oxidoreductase (nitroreductase family)